MLKRVRSVRWRVFFTLVPPGGKASERSERSMTFLLLEGGREGKSLQNDYLRWDFRNFQVSGNVWIFRNFQVSGNVWIFEIC